VEPDGSGAAVRQRPARPGWRRIGLGLGPALVLALVALWELVAVGRAGADVPDDAAWAAAAAAVRAAHHDGDLIVFAPRWIDPVGRLHLGDLIPLAMAGRMDAARYGTIWELSIRGARAPETAGLTAASTEAHGGVVVRRFVREPAVVLTDFVEAAPRAETEGRRTSGPKVLLTEVGFEPHRCVQVEPPPDGTVKVVFRGARLGKELVGHVGLADVFKRRDVRDPGQLELLVDGASAAKVRFGVDDGWVRFAAPTRPTEAAEVVFAVTALGPRARDRLICFAAEARQ
jgi:hypothetical protein